jgi:3-isopropylmalate/(R)-2-methylmalate dehydratase small subunit
MILEGKVWKFGDEINTDVIIPAQYCEMPPDKYKRHVMEPLRSDFFSIIQEGDFIFAGEEFGMGSSRGHAIVAIKEAGIRAIVAASFGRIFYRSAINEGLQVFVCPEAYHGTDEGDQVTIDVASGIIDNRSKNLTFRFQPFPDLVMKIILAGGGVNYFAKNLGEIEKEIAESCRG